MGQNAHQVLFLKACSQVRIMYIQHININCCTTQMGQSQFKNMQRFYQHLWPFLDFF